MNNSPYNRYATNKTAEADGIDLDFDGFAIRVRRAGGNNAHYQQTMERLFKPYRKQQQAGTLSPAKTRELLIQAYVTAVVVGWSNVVDAEGKPLPYTQGNAIRLFTDLPDLFDEVMEGATFINNFRAEQIEADAGNSLTA